MFLMASAGFAQTKSEAVKLYEAGNRAFSKNDYRAADSLFSLSLALEPHPDAYYNRAVCRRKMNDFKGYCLDLHDASELGDLEANKLYWKQCAKRDTVFKRDGEVATKLDFDIVEFTTTYKYNTDFEYLKCDTAGIAILSKLRTNNVIMYRPCREVKAPQFLGSIDSLVQYVKTKTEFSRQVQEQELTGYSHFTIVTNENGKITSAKAHAGIMDQGIGELLNAFLNMPNWNPAVFNEKTVKFQSDLSITYYDDVIEIYPIVVSQPSMDEVYSIVEKMPEFPGGPMEMMKYIQKSIQYPQSAKEDGLTGKIFLRFVVSAEGSIANVQILKGIKKCQACNKEAVRVIRNMPKWKPGTQNGKPVPVFFNLPINFHLK